MSEILLTRHDGAAIPAADRDAARRVLFGVVDGVGDRERRKWRGFVRRLMQLKPGEIVEIRTHQERIGVYHRRHMLLEHRVFEAQERFEQFDQFRVWLKIGAGFCDWLPGPKGAVVPVPRSTSYAKLEQGEMEKVHRDMVDFLRSPHAAKTLWPKVPAEQREAAIDLVLSEFGWFGEAS